MAERLVAPGLGARVDASTPDVDSSPLGTRLVAYAIDSVVLFGVTMLFATFAFLNIFLRSDNGQTSTTDGATWASVGVLMLAIPCWLLFNLLLTLKRGQTIGQYIVGLDIVDAEGGSPTQRRLAGYWLALHPLIFHPIFAGLWLLLGVVSGLSLSQNGILLVLNGAMALLCLAVPVASLLFALADPQRRAIHDRLAGIKVVRTA